MRTSFLFTTILGFVLYPLINHAQSYSYKFQNPDLPIEERVDNLVGQLTLEEKISQMMNNAPAIQRLNIPAYNWWNECLHGIARSPYHTTSYPQAIGIAATWNPEAVQKMTDQISDEGRAIYHDATRKGKTGIFLGLSFWSPNINIFRDPRWGRGQETYGEDPFLTGAIGTAFVTGLQGNDPHYLKSSACAKHYAVHSGPEWNRHTYNAQISNYDLWDTYLPAFEQLVKQAKVTGVMCAYNSFFGQPCCGNDLLMTDILRNQWKFDGYVTSDCGGIEDFYKHHKTHPDEASAAADAVLHGTDCECSHNGAYQALADAIGEGLITEEQLDTSVKRLFKLRFQMGMFDPEQRVPYARIPTSVLECREHQEHALEMARQSIVLLKNENDILPLKKTLKKIAVIGPNADDKAVLLANYYGYPSKVTTLLEGIKQKVGNNTEIIYKQGIGLTDNLVFTSTYDTNLFSYNGTHGFFAEYYQNMDRKGKPGLSRMEKKIDYQWGDGEDIANGIITRELSATWKSTFIPDKTGEVCFKLHADDRANLYINGVLQEKTGNTANYFPLSVQKGEKYDIFIEYWQFADNAEITFDMGILEETDCQTIASSVKDADVIIYAGGISVKLEGEEMGVNIEGFKKGDRTSIALPSIQSEMIKALHATGKPVVFVLMTGSAIGLEWESKNLPAILNTWYGGQAGGEAIADVLFGDYNPAGRLPVTFYKKVEDLPDFEDYNMNNRTYRYFTGEVVYPFGYGLSYTTFQYDQLEIQSLPGSKGIKVSAIVKNSGQRDGDEVVQLYLSHLNKTHVPLKSLKGFKRIHLAAGESQKVEFLLTQKDLSIVTETGESIYSPGNIDITVGGGQPSSNASGTILTKSFFLQ